MAIDLAKAKRRVNSVVGLRLLRRHPWECNYNSWHTPSDAPNLDVISAIDAEELGAEPASAIAT